MYLVDTSVWIGLFRQQETEAVFHLREILEQQIPFGISSVIYQELLQGAKGESDYQQLQEYLGSQHFYHPIDERESYANAARIYFDCRRKGVTIRSTIDCLIAEITIEYNLILLHDDVDFNHMANVVTGLKVSSA
jgi:predicted nucleic acid-binding protein